MLDELILIAKILFAAFCAYMYSQEWTKAGQVINWLYKLSEDALPEWLHKPFIGCFRCVCAQWAMWTYVVQTTVFHASEFNFFYMFGAALTGTAVGIISHKILNDE